MSTAAPKKKSRPRKVEAAIQKAVVAWCRERPLFALAFHIDNEGKKSIGKAKQDQRMGVLAGMPDLCIPLPGGRVLWLELKTKKGRLSKIQKAMHREMRDMGQEVLTAYGYDHAIEILASIDGQYFERGRA